MKIDIPDQLIEDYSGVRRSICQNQPVCVSDSMRGPSEIGLALDKARNELLGHIYSKLNLVHM